MTYYVGIERKSAETMPDAFRIAVEELGEKKAGKTIRIYHGQTKNIPVATIEILPDKDGRLCYAVFYPRSRTGHALGADFHTIRAVSFPNIKYARKVRA